MLSPSAWECSGPLTTATPAQTCLDTPRATGTVSPHHLLHWHHKPCWTKTPLAVALQGLQLAAVLA
jgi:hypothetical protein